MKFFYFFNLILLPSVSESHNITATGGGVVKPGSDLELSLELGKVWDRCRWFLYHTLDDYESCTFDLNANFGNGTLHKCSNETLTSIMTYTGSDSSHCTITIANVNENYNCTWAGR